MAIQHLKNYTSLITAIHDIVGDSVHIVNKRPVSGGDINNAYALELSDGGCIFMKTNTVKNAPFFTAEKYGLKAIADTHAIGVPEVLGYGTDGDSYSFLLLSFIRSERKIDRYWEIFGTELATMHAMSYDHFGFDEDNFIGATRQINDRRSTFLDFFRDCRLEPQFRMADRYLSDADRKKRDRLLDHMDDYFIEPDHPSLVHGDLWSGNHMTGSDGKAWIIDPAVYIGHPEVDLAMTELFGRCPESFYMSYNEASSLQPGYADRKDFYNLYQLLNHLNLFGSGYLSSVRQILAKV